MNKKVSLKDIAKAVGVSVATVSYVLSKGANSKISKEVSEKVKTVAKNLNYQPNQIAKSLKTGKTYTIGLIVADIANPFFSNIARIIEDEASKLNYIVIFGSCDENPDKSWDLIQFLMNRQVDGFIIAPAERTENQIEYLKNSNVPFVLIDRWFPNIQTNVVCIDNFKASYEAIAKLIKTGYKKIGIIAYSTNLHHMQQRVEGYCRALTDHSIAITEKFIKKIDFFNMENEVNSAIEDLLNGKEKVNAIFFATNTLAILGLKHISYLNFIVPSDVAVICFDEGEAFNFYYCPITYIKQPILELSKRAVNILTACINDNSTPLQQITLKADLILRKSCGK